MDTLKRAALLATAATTFFNTGLQWYTQASTYPLFHDLAGEGFVPYHKAYEGRLPLSIYTPYVALMASTAALLIARPAGVGRGPVLALLALDGSIMVESLTLAAPIHAQLDREGKDDAAIGRLVRLNALRLAAATASSAIVLRLLGDALAER